MASIAVKLLGISCFLSCGGLALAQGHVWAEAGSDVLLPCLFNTSVPDDKFTWERKLANESSVQVKAYATISRPGLWVALCAFGVPDPLLTIIKDLHHHADDLVLSFDKKPTPRLPNIEWAGDLSRGDASVKISAVRMEDAGHYTCETFNLDFILSITLSVVSKGISNNNITMAAVALLVIAFAVVGFIAKKKWRRRRSRENESETPPSTELQVLATTAGTA